MRLLGGFEATLASGAAVDLPGQKDRALLAILALAPAAGHSRDRLAGLLWSDRGDRQARDSLKQSLTRLRRGLGNAAALLVADRLTVRLEAGGIDSDVARFERLAGATDRADLAAAAALYRGELLEGLAVRDPSFEEWLLVERQRLRQRLEAALARLMAAALAGGDRAQASAAAQRLLGLDPLREAAVRTLMQLQAEDGETAQALRLYEALAERLRRELGVAPEPATTQLFEALRERRSPQAAPQSTAEVVLAPSAELPLPGKPSLAVLPFQNLGGDLEQEYFADGMVEEIITALSRIGWLFVIARNSSFTFKGRTVDAKQIGRELGVRYLLEGSVRRAAGRVRIAGRLVDAASGQQLWADRFEAGLEDVFDLQDQVAASVVGAIAPRLEQAEIERARRKPTGSLDAYDYYLRGMAGVHDWSREANAQALAAFGRATALDPQFAAAYGMAARCYSQRKVSGWVVDQRADIAEAERLARRAVELGRDDAVALGTAGIVLAYVVGELEEGNQLIERALALDPNWAWGWLFGGWVKVWLGEAEPALDRVARAMRLSPRDPQRFNMSTVVAWGHFLAGRYAEARGAALAALSEKPDYVSALRLLAAAGALGGWPEDAARAMARLATLDPGASIAGIRARDPLRRDEDLARFAEGLRRAGLPD
ncbi:MAG: BTAD domain-containing putative transcriptional regulator [Dongiaceae bacterium]